MHFSFIKAVKVIGSAMIFFSFFLLVILSYFHLWLKNRRNFWKNLGFEYVELEFPFGAMKGVGTKKSLCVVLEEYHKKFKGKAKAVGLFSFVKPLLLVIDTDLIKNIMIQNFDSFHDRNIFYNQRDDPISAHLVAIRGNEWRERRAKLTPTFTSGKMKMMFETIHVISDQLVKAIENSIKSTNLIEMREMSARYTTDVISSVAFGMDSNCLSNPDSEMRKYGKDLLDLGATGFLRFMFTCSFPEISRKLHLTANKPSVIDFFYNTFRANIEQRERTKIYCKDFLQILLELKKSSTLSIDELAAESFIFYLGGFETSSSLISFALYELTLNPDIQIRLRDEITSALEKNDGNFTYELLNSIKYLEMVANEVLRKYPPGFFISRLSTKDFKIPDTDLVIPKGTDINISNYAIHHDPEYYPEPEKFDPERFTPENIKSRPACTFLAFGDGPRRCIGGRFGMMQSKMGLAKLILNFEFSPCERTQIPIVFSPSAIFLESEEKIWLNVKKL